MARLTLRRRHPRPDRTPEVALRLAVLLQAGVAPDAAWRFLAESGEDDAAAVVASHAAGTDLGAAIALCGDRWAPIGAAWRVAADVGAPLAHGLRAVATALRDADECRDEVRVALAEPASTARLMSWLPLVAVLLGIALGFDTIGVLTTTPAGIACLAVGVLLMVCARRWTARLVRGAGPAPEVAGLTAELIAIALSGGVSVERARRLAAEALPLPSPSERVADDESPPGSGAEEEVDRILQLSRSAGVPAAELLRAAAAMARQRARTDGRMRASRLSASLLLPLGACVLPAFIVLGVAPMLMSILSSGSFGL
ncbi:type II secretion system F family protein [Microbacterium sp. 18062]|uniref:type II secretion system F family protein n=1 Tax=Microbacterium sp. 18062 TaxID=2681410 RepID=UPI001357D69F|nr:type II secretion system F family protein [Microbacterium sp. 18062]